MPGTFLPALLIVLLSAFIGGVLAKKFKQPLILGYLLAGFVASFFIKALGVDRSSLDSLAEIGLTLLMFSLGLEFSFKKNIELKKVIVVGSLAQIFGVIFLGFFFLVFVLGFEPRSSLILSAAFSLSSTAIVVKILNEKNLSESLPGEIMTGWLLVQDLAVLPMIASLPVIFNSGGWPANIFFLGKAALVVALILIGGRKLVPALTDRIASFKSRELLLLMAVCLIFIFSGLTRTLGFSYGLGAFVAGLVLNQATAHLAIFSEIRPLRDVFLAVFFVSLGLSLSQGLLPLAPLRVLAVGSGFLILKAVLVLLILACFGYHARTFFLCAFGLSQVGEFAFVLASAAASSGFLNGENYSLVVLVTLWTMVLTPWLFSAAGRVYRWASIRADKFPWLKEKFFSHFDGRPGLEELPFSDHAVVLGYGRVGKWVGAALESSKIPYLVVEYNPRIVKELKLQGKNTVFGDPTDIDVLDFAQIDKAKLAVIAIPDPEVLKIIIANCQTLNPRIKIVCRSHFEEEAGYLHQMGVDHIIQPEFEAALSMAHRAMQYFGFSKEEISEKIREIKREHG